MMETGVMITLTWMATLLTYILILAAVVLVLMVLVIAWEEISYIIKEMFARFKAMRTAQRGTSIETKKK